MTEPVDFSARFKETSHAPRPESPRKKPDERRALPPPSRPMDVARVYIEAERRFNGNLTLRYWRGSFWTWQTTHWTEAEDAQIRAALYGFTEHAVYVAPTADGKVESKTWAPNSKKISDLVDALRAVSFLDKNVTASSWLDGRQTGPIIAVANGLLDVDKDVLIAHTPLFFGLVSVPFGFNRTAPQPLHFLGFLDTVWPKDEEFSTGAVACLQEVYGYVVSGRLDLHKIMLMQGPRRSGKGVMARLLAALIGGACWPTISSFGDRFALEQTIGQGLAVIADARSGEGQRATISGDAIERLLSISGGDPIDVQRKNKPTVVGVRLLIRFLIISNLLPKFNDASGAIVTRLVILQTKLSFLGKEDREIESRVKDNEMPGPLNWALAGLKRLYSQQNGKFTRQPAAEDAVNTLLGMASPVSTYVEENCIIEPAAKTATDTLYTDFKEWYERNGLPKTDNAQFGRDLMAAFPSISRKRDREGKKRSPFYHGIRFRSEADDQADTTIPGL